MIGVPWAARVAVAKMSNTKSIAHDRARLYWEEKTTSSLVTKTQELWLDRREQLDTMPVDSSVVAITSWEEEEEEPPAPAPAAAADGSGAAAAPTSPVLRSRYHYRGPGVLQEITRRLEEGGRVYRVVNEMTREGAPGKPLVAHIIYDRVE